MIRAGQTSEYYKGCREAIYQYAINGRDHMIVGCGMKTYAQAIAEVDILECESEKADSDKRQKLLQVLGLKG